MGAPHFLGLELFKLMTGTKIEQISYKAIQQAITDTIAGQIQIVFDNAPSILPHVRAGRLRALGVLTPNRSPVLPDIPTIAEAGVPGFEVAPLGGYLLPAHTPRAIVLHLNAEINKALKTAIVMEKFHCWRPHCSWRNSRTVCRTSAQRDGEMGGRHQTRRHQARLTTAKLCPPFAKEFNGRYAKSRLTATGQVDDTLTRIICVIVMRESFLSNSLFMRIEAISR